MIVSITGHRPNKLSIHEKLPYPNSYSVGGGYAYSRLTSLFYFALQEVGATHVISGMALGADMAAAQAAIYMDVPFTAAVPFEGQESQWPDSSQQYYKYLLQHADEVRYICDAGYAAWKMQRRNEWMVDNSNLVVALWNGTSGGTGNCVNYAITAGQDIRNYWDVWDKHKEGKFEFSNFQRVPIAYGDGITYPSVENFYQAMKTKDMLLRQRMADMTPEQAKQYGRNLASIREDWEMIKLNVMKFGLQKKFDNPKFQAKLIETRHKPLIEWNTWGDTFWGVDIDSEKGENQLGKLIMEIREQYIGG